MALPQTIGRYEILAELGHGAMGAVYKARDPLMDRVVAVKTILAGALSGPMAQEYRDRFVREARAAGRLSHPGIVTVFDVGEHEGTPFLVMEYVEGRTLEQALDAREQFSFERLCDLAHQIAEALGYAHRNGVVHRDIKPANVLLAAGGAGVPERAKITDLGVAKISASQITTTGQLLGTPSFMAPEQFTGAPVDGRSDIFSLGVMLYWMAAGEKPFGGDTVTSVSYKIVHTETIPPRKLNPAIPEGLERVIVKCLEKDPSRRYQTGEQLATDVSAVRAGRVPGFATAPTDPNATFELGVQTPMPAGERPGTMFTAPVAPVPTPRQGSSRNLLLAAGGLLLVAAVVIVVLLVRRSTPASVVNQSAQIAQSPAPQATPPPPVNSQPQLPETGPPKQPLPLPTGGAAQSAKQTPTPAGKTTIVIPEIKVNVPAAGTGGMPPEAAAALDRTNKQVADAMKRLEVSVPPTAAVAHPVSKAPAATLAASARLKVNAGRIPDAVNFLVLMDGKPFFSRPPVTNTNDDATREDQVVPPGEHEFSVIALPPIMLGKSNPVRATFVERRKKLLVITLRDTTTGRVLKKDSKIESLGADFNLALQEPGFFRR